MMMILFFSFYCIIFFDLFRESGREGKRSGYGRDDMWRWRRDERGKGREESSRRRRTVDWT